MERPTRSLLRHPDFLKLWTAETISVFGSAITQLALPLIAATTLDVTPFEFGLLTTIEFLPFILFSLPAGVWVDRLRRRPILIAGDLGRAIAIASIPVAFAFDALTIWQLYIVGFVNGILTVFFDVSYQSYVPSVVDRDQLVDGNSKLEITRSAAQILGPGMAGILIGLLKAPFAMLLDSLSYLVSAIFVFFIRRPEPPVVPHDEAAHGPKPSMRQEIAVGVRYVTGHRWLRSIAATTGTSNFFGNVGGAILILYLTRERGLGPAAIGFAFSVGSVGVLVAAFVTAWITRRLGVGRTLVLMAFGFSISGLPVAFAPDALIWYAVALSGFLGGFCGVGWNINQVSLRQAITPPRMQGKMNATMRFIVWGTMPIGAILGGALASVIGLQETIVVGALGGLIAFIPVTLSSVRHIVKMPEQVDDEAPAMPMAAAPQA
ncbi:MAG TPA: MFS transporter [Candidatus Limnocylindrales bacterium]|jgi:MFS family permease|nr:MFS transporter [Candidatus Limnocylindrales bacterium]